MDEIGRYCIDCKHSLFAEDLPPGTRHPKPLCVFPARNAVTGELIEPIGVICEVSRGLWNQCGPRGRFWERK